MTKLKAMLLGIALALPIAAFGAGSQQIATLTQDAAVPAKVKMGPTQFKCCWFYYMGIWWCVEYC